MFPRPATKTGTSPFAYNTAKQPQLSPAVVRADQNIGMTKSIPAISYSPNTGQLLHESEDF